MAMYTDSTLIVLEFRGLPLDSGFMVRRNVIL